MVITMERLKVFQPHMQEKIFDELEKVFFEHELSHSDYITYIRQNADSFGD